MTSSSTRARASSVKQRTTGRNRLLPVMPSLDLDMVGATRLNGIAADARLVDAVTDVQATLTMNGASTLALVVEDPDLELLNSPLLSTRVDLDIGAALRSERRWRLDQNRGAGGIDVVGTATTLTFWQLGAAALKTQTGSLAKPSTQSFAAFVAYMAREVRRDVTLTPLVTNPNAPPPRLDNPDTQKERTDQAESNGGSGWSTSATTKIKLKGVAADRDQLKVLDVALQTAVDAKAPLRATLALVVALIIESVARNLAGGDRDSRGPLQVRDSTARPRGLNNRSTKAVSREFLDEGYWGKGGAIALAKANPGWTVGQIAQAVQGSAFEERYDTVRHEADVIVAEWTGRPLGEWNRTVRSGHGATGASRTRRDIRPNEWRRGTATKPESSWAALQRYSDKMGRRRFISASRLVVASDQSLIKATPHLTLALDDPIVLERPTITLDGTADLEQIELTVLRGAWGVPPAGVVQIEGAGTANGPWLVETIRASAGTPEARVMLTQPVTEKPKEPKRSKTSSGSTTGKKATKGAEAAIAWANTKVGVRESGFNGGQTVEYIIRKAGGSAGDAWCGWFCANALMAGGVEDVPTGIGSVRWIYDSAAANRHPFSGRGSAASAQPGDLAVIYGAGTHVELVVRVNTSRKIVHTIGGNTSMPGGGEGVARKERPFSDVVGVAHVKYPES